jgi:hypothetical protein
MKKIERTENNIISISLAFSAMKYNLFFIEENWSNNKKNIPVTAYFNFLCLYALCIELGLKEIIINQTDIDKTHNIKDLFYKTHNVFQKKIHLLYENDFNTYFKLDDFLIDISNMFEDLRYFNINVQVNYGKFLENDEKEIDFKELTEKNPYLQFLILFCEEIKYLLIFLDEESRKKSKLNYPGLNKIEKINIWKKKILDECLTLEEVKI